MADNLSPRISAVVLTQNVAGLIERCLHALSFCDEIVVVDAESTDGTDVIARDLGARVVTNPWPGFAAQRRVGLEATAGEWVFMCDSDEVATPELAAEIQSVIVKDPGGGPVGFYVKRRNRYMGRLMRHGPWANDLQLRLFRRSAGSVTEQSVHEGVTVEGETAVLESPLDHYTHHTIADSVERINRYTSLEAGDRVGRRRIRIVDPVFPPVGVFLNYYLRQGCWRDGVAGFVLSVTTAIYKSLLYIKIYLLQRGIEETTERR